jgi:hypothetical protein
MSPRKFILVFRWEVAGSIHSFSMHSRHKHEIKFNELRHCSTIFSSVRGQLKPQNVPLRHRRSRKAFHIIRLQVHVQHCVVQKVPSSLCCQSRRLRAPFITGAIESTGLSVLYNAVDCH